MLKKVSFLTAMSVMILGFQIIALGQTTGSIVGTVLDQSGAVVPNATVVAKGQGGQEFTTVTSDNGTFKIPAVGNGVYTLTVSADGFKKAVVNNVKVDVGTPSAVTATLEVGSVSQTVEVIGGAEVLQTETATVGTTIVGRQIVETPLTSRDALDLVALLPGTAQVGRPRASTINGLPKGSLSITVDGVDVGSQLLRSSDGFFTFVRPRLDEVEEVTVSTAAGGAESTGDGAIQIKFATKRGTNEYKGSAFWHHRNYAFNSNYWFNNLNGLPRTPIRLNQFGGNIGGPLPFFNFSENGGMFHSGKDKSFFFVNHEQFRLPESVSRTRSILTTQAASGIFSYGNQQVNLLNLAAANGFPSTIDPTIGALLSDIRSAVSQTGTITPSNATPNVEFFNYNPTSDSKRYFTTVRLDFNLTKDHALENIFKYQIFGGTFDFLNSMEPRFPGFPNFGSQSSDRYSNSTALRSTFTNYLVNEARFNYTYGPSSFAGEVNPRQFANQGGFNLTLNGITSATARNSSSSRNSPIYEFTDNVTWLSGNHSINFGGQYKRVKLRLTNVSQVVPSLGFGIDATDPAGNALFNLINFPGASNTQLAEAAGLYSMLVGRVTSINGSAYLTEEGQYEFLGERTQRAEQVTYGLYAQDSWRIRPNLTLNFGLRWQPQLPFTTRSGNYSVPTSFADLFGVSGEGNLFMPGTLTGSVPTFFVARSGYKAHNADYNNFAPSLGIVYSPDFGEKGFFSGLFGKGGQSVFRAGYSRSFVREGTNVAQTALSLNRGASLNANRSVSLGTIPVGTLFQNIGSIPAPTFPNTPPAVLTGTAADLTIGFNPNIKTGVVDSWNFSYQRELNKNTVLEIRYVGNRGRDLWRTFGLNEYNLTENGFAAEFVNAQSNQAANIAAGRGNTFAYFGPGTGTVPLPIIQAHFRGAGDLNNPAQYTSSLYRDRTFNNQLSTVSPSAIGFAQRIDSAGFLRANAIAGGLPANFFIVNPTTRGGSFVVDNGTNSSYDAAVIELRRRLSNGLLISGSYTYSKSLADFYGSSSIVFRNFSTLRNRDLDKTTSPFDLRHAFKVNWIYELPFGKGKAFFKDINRWTDALVGGWSVIGALRMQSGSPVSFGHVQLVGMTPEELENSIGVYHNIQLANGSAIPAAYLPADIIDNSAAAANLQPFNGRAIAPATFGNCIEEFTGQCGFTNLVLHGPNFAKLDVSLSKKIRFDERRNVELRAAFYNALNSPQFRIGGWSSNAPTANFGSTTFGQFLNGTAYQDTSTTNDPGGRIIELVLRINF